MGIAREDVQFPAALPTLEAVRAAVARRSGLAVGLTATDDDRGLLVFACLPDLPIEVRRHARTRPFGKTESCVPTPDTVEVTADLHQEPTLFFQTCQALHALGGTSDDPPKSGEMDAWLRPVGEADLVRRVRKKQRQARVMFWGAAFIYLLLTPVWLLLAGLAVLVLAPLVVFGYLLRDFIADRRLSAGD